MPIPIPTNRCSDSSPHPDLPLAAGLTLLVAVGCIEPAAQLPAGALATTTLLLLLLGAVRRRVASARPPRA